MKLFLKKILIFLIPVAAFLCLFEVLLRSIPNEYSYKKERMITDAQNIEVLILGSSHSFFGIDPEFISPRAFNAAQVSQTLDIDYKLLVKYGERMKNLRCVLIPISYFSLYLRKNFENRNLKNNIIYQDLSFELEFFSPQNYFQLLNGTVESNVKKLLLLSEQENVRTRREGEIRIYSEFEKKIITISENGFHQHNNRMNEAKMKEDAEYREKIQKNYRNRPVNYNEEILINIIDWCAARNIQVFFFTVPAYKTYINNLNAAQLYGTVAYMEDLARRYDNVTYENFLFEYKDKRGYFRDSDHLNAAGARAFSAQIHGILQERGLVD